MREGSGKLARYRHNYDVAAAPIVSVDHALAQVTIAMPDGSHEVRNGRPSMFGVRIPVPGDWYVESIGGHRAVMSRAAFEGAFVPAPPPLAPPPRPAGFDVCG